MHKMTLRETYAKGLAAAGWDAIPSRSKKFLTYHRSGNFMFLGKNGSIRLAKLNRIDSSIPLRPSAVANVVRWATVGYTGQANEIKLATELNDANRQHFEI